MFKLAVFAVNAGEIFHLIPKIAQVLDLASKIPISMQFLSNNKCHIGALAGRYIPSVFIFDKTLSNNYLIIVDEYTMGYMHLYFILSRINSSLV